MASDFQKLIGKHKNLSEAAQIQAGQAIHGKMAHRHYDFLKAISALLKAGTIDVHAPTSFLNHAIYDKLDEASRGKVDQANVNIAEALRHIADFYHSTQTPDESPHLETMIEQLFLMKSRVEDEYGDVFIF